MGWDGWTEVEIGYVLDSFGSDNRVSNKNYIWNTGTLAWEAATGSLTGGGNVTVVNFPSSYDVSDRATRDMGKIDVASLDQYTPVGGLLPGLIYGKTGDATYQSPRIDVQTHSMNTLSFEHHEIHGGNHFFIRGIQDLSINQVLDFTLLMPNTTKWIHFIWRIDVESETPWYFYETATATNPLANAITVFNNDRNSATTSGATMKYEIQANLVAANADTNVTGATLLESGIAGSGKQGGNHERDNELILKQNTLYCLRMIANTAGYINYELEWYEHTNRTA